MNKKVMLIILGVVVLAIGGILLVQRMGLLTKGTVGIDIPADQNTISKAFTGSGSVRCTYTDESSSGTAFIKDGKMRYENTYNEGQGIEGTGVMIMKEGVMYTWEQGSTEGLMIDTNSFENVDTPEDMANEFVTPDDVMQEIEQKSPECSEESIDDALFDPPADVTFTNYSQMMQNNSFPQDLQAPEGM